MSTLCLSGILNIVQCGRNKDQVSKIITSIDTLYLYDTIRIDKPIPKSIRNIDTILVEVKDTIHIEDTIYIKLPKEQKVYQQENYQAWISGYQPVLDSIHIFRNTRQIINSTTIQSNQNTNRWSIGIQAGYGVTSQQNIIKITPYIGVGFSYRLFTF